MADDQPEQQETTERARQTVVLLAVVVEGGLIVLAWLFGWLVDEPPLRTLAWDFRDFALGLAAAVPMLLLFFAFLRWPVGPMKRIKKFCDEALVPILAPCTLLDLAGISVLAGLGEEMLFRGVLQGACARWTGSPWIAIAVASVIFGALHAVTLTYAVYAGLMGAYLGWLWHVNGNLLLVVVAHAVYDFIALVVLVRGCDIEPPLARSD